MHDAPYNLSLDSRPESLTEMVYDTIRQAIVSRRIPPGARVTEIGLADQLGVSKTPVREALLRLRQVGVVEVDRRALKVVYPSRAAIREAYEVREALEVFAARQAAAHATSEALDAVGDTADRSLAAAQAGQRSHFGEWDYAFHRAVADAAGNRRIWRMIEDCYTLIQTLRQRDLPHVEASIECGQGHTAVADAIAQRDADAAADAMREHLRTVARYVMGENERP